jgi:hypothetical protein
MLITRDKGSCPLKKNIYLSGLLRQKGEGAKKNVETSWVVVVCL